MTEVVLRFIREQAEKLDLDEPVVEFGSMRVAGQEHFADIRTFFPDMQYVGCDFRPGDGVDLIDDMEMSHFAPSSVGTVICLETLEHVMHPTRALAEAYRILTPGGTLLASVPFKLPIHAYPHDYWRMTPKGLEVMLREAGFEEVDTWDSGEDFLPGLPYPFTTFGVARKVPSAGTFLRTDKGFSVEKADGYRSSAITRARTHAHAEGPRPEVPFVIPLYGREEKAREMFRQLAEVTDGYRLVLVDNGFDDPEMIEGLAPSLLIKNSENVGPVHALNQGIESCGESPYIGVLHTDSLIFEDAWLDHVIEFMERRPDVGIVGLCGWRSVASDGKLDMETTVYQHEMQFSQGYKPSWRFSEVSVVDGFALVARNLGFRLDETLGFMHCYDLDLCMQYIEAGYRVYAANVDCSHMAGFGWHSMRTEDDYLKRIGGDDESYQDEVRERFRNKWKHLLPITRGYTDEVYGYIRVNELLEDLDRAEERIKKAFQHIARVQDEYEKRGTELESAAVYAREIEQRYAATVDLVEQLTAVIEDGPPRHIDVVSPPLTGSTRANITKIKHCLATVGIAATVRRSISYMTRRLRGR